jgi:hypothetical protein
MHEYRVSSDLIKLKEYGPGLMEHQNKLPCQIPRPGPLKHIYCADIVASNFGTSNLIQLENVLRNRVPVICPPPYVLTLPAEADTTLDSHGGATP